MQPHEAKVASVLFIWAAFTVVMIGLLAADKFHFITAAVIAGAAVFGTASVWQQESKADAEARAQVEEKAKRRGRVDRFIEQLSDEELEHLRARLMTDDGEMVSVEELLTEVEARRGR
jgi:hypothetical protein